MPDTPASVRGRSRVVGCGFGISGRSRGGVSPAGPARSPHRHSEKCGRPPPDERRGERRWGRGGGGGGGIGPNLPCTFPGKKSAAIPPPLPLLIRTRRRGCESPHPAPGRDGRSYGCRAGGTRPWAAAKSFAASTRRGERRAPVVVPRSCPLESPSPPPPTSDARNAVTASSSPPGGGPRRRARVRPSRRGSRPCRRRPSTRTPPPHLSPPRRLLRPPRSSGRRAPRP